MKRQLLLVSLLTGLSQLAAFFKLWLTARIFGVGGDIDGYYLALIGPALVSGVIGGVIQTGLFPIRAQLAARHNQTQVDQFERAVFWGCNWIGLIFSLVIFLSSGLLTDIFARSAPPQTQQAFLLTITICSSLVWLNIASDCLSYLLAFRNKFAYAAGATILNGAAGSLIIALLQNHGVFALAASTIIGASIQLLIIAAGLVSLGFPLAVKVKLTEACHSLLTVLKAGGWIVPGVVFSNLIVFLPPIWASSFGEGAVSAFNYAYRLHSSIVQLLVMASSTILLARLSELHAAGDVKAIKKLILQSAYISTVLGLLIVLATWGLGAPTLELVFGGKFDMAAAQRVADTWVYLSLGLGFVLFGNVVSKLWQAQGRPKLMTVMAATSLGLVMCLQWALNTSLGESSIPIALSMMAAVNVLVGLRFLGLSIPQCK